MENSKQTENKKYFSSSLKTLFVGILIVLVSGLFVANSIALEFFGERAVGKLSNAAKNCSGSKTCWTSKVDFTTKNGEQITFYPWTFPLLFDLDPLLSGRPYADYGNFEIQYFENIPKLAKVSVAFHLEDVGKTLVFFFGIILILLALLSLVNNKSDSPRQPFVINLRKKQ